MKIFCRQCKQADCRCPKKGSDQWSVISGRVRVVIERRRAVAVLAASGLDDLQLRLIYAMLPPDAQGWAGLAERWELALVIASPAWAEKQFSRVPMLPPKGVPCLL
jgi:hypothetical protein